MRPSRFRDKIKEMGITRAKLSLILLLLLAGIAHATPPGRAAKRHLKALIKSCQNIDSYLVVSRLEQEDVLNSTKHDPKNCKVNKIEEVDKFVDSCNVSGVEVVSCSTQCLVEAKISCDQLLKDAKIEVAKYYPLGNKNNPEPNPKEERINQNFAHFLLQDQETKPLVHQPDPQVTHDDPPIPNNPGAHPQPAKQ